MTEDADARPASPAPPRDRRVLVLIIVATFGLQGLTLVTGVIMARMLGVEGRGIVALIFALGLFASQLTFGSSLPRAMAKNLAERGVTARDGMHDIARRRILLLIPPSLVAGAIAYVIAPGDDTGTRYLLAAAAFGMALQTLLSRILLGGLQGEGRLVRMAWVGLMPQLLFTIVLTTAFVADWGWEFEPVLVAYFAAGIVGLWFAYVSMLPPRHAVGDRLDEAELWTEARRSYVSAVHPLDSLQLDRIALVSLGSAALLGLYTAAAAVSNLCSLVSNAVGVVVLPRVAMNWNDPGAQRAVILRWTGLAAALVTVVAGLLQLVVDPVIRLAFGAEFVGAITAARWLILADALMAFRKVLIAVLQGAGRGGSASLVELTILPFMLVGVCVAASNGSLVAVAIALGLSGLVSCLALGWSIRSHLARAATPSHG